MAIRDLIKTRNEKDIMLLKFNDSNIPGIFSIDGFIDLRGLTPIETAKLICERINSK